MEKVKKITKLIYLLPILWAVVLRCSVGLFPYSGKNKPYIYGDFEAQRHWMEITINHPINQWYFNSSTNDLNYWGLDYPPLTAYHSYFLGIITTFFNSNWTTLYDSRGSENPNLVTLMRFFVLITDILIYLPALCYYYFILCPKLSNKVVNLELILCGLFFPGIILIDHGHFQYNVASLGLFIIAMILFLSDKNVLGSIFFSAALCYKQMELYHSLPIFFFLLGKCLKSSQRLKNLMKISLAVVSTFLLIFSPFILIDPRIQSVSQILHRLFPVSRGIFEDKVSNFWCAISVLYKFENIDSSTVVMICATLTLLFSMPACLAVFFNTRKKLHFLYASLVVSMAFFLFSYQVHEKSILIPAVSAILLIPFEPFWANFFLYVATLSMSPLLVKDQLGLATVVCCGIFLVFFIKEIILASRIEKFTFVIFNFIFFSIMFLWATIDPPARYPFLFPLMISQLCCGTFFVHFLYFNWAIFYSNKRL